MKRTEWRTKITPHRKTDSTNSIEMNKNQTLKRALSEAVKLIADRIKKKESALEDLTLLLKQNARNATFISCHRRIALCINSELMKPETLVSDELDAELFRILAEHGYSDYPPDEQCHTNIGCRLLSSYIANDVNVNHLISYYYLPSREQWLNILVEDGVDATDLLRYCCSLENYPAKLISMLLRNFQANPTETSAGVYCLHTFLSKSCYWWQKYHAKVWEAIHAFYCCGATLLEQNLNGASPIKLIACSSIHYQSVVVDILHYVIPKYDKKLRINILNELKAYQPRIDPYFAQITKENYVYVVEYLRYGVNLDSLHVYIPGIETMTALMYACKLDRYVVAHALVDAGADVYIRNELSKAAIDYVNHNSPNWEEFANLLVPVRENHINDTKKRRIKS